MVQFSIRSDLPCGATGSTFDSGSENLRSNRGRAVNRFGARLGVPVTPLDRVLRWSDISALPMATHRGRAIVETRRARSSRAGGAR